MFNHSSVSFTWVVFLHKMFSVVCLSVHVLIMILDWDCEHNANSIKKIKFFSHLSFYHKTTLYFQFAVQNRSIIYDCTTFIGAKWKRYVKFVLVLFLTNRNSITPNVYFVAHSNSNHFKTYFFVKQIHRRLERND